MVWLQLEETSINEVPQSVTGRLEYLCLNGCSKITKFPENLEDIEELKLRGTAIKEVPSSTQFLTRLRDLDMSGCSKLESFPEITEPIKSLVELNLSKTGIKEIPSSSCKHMISLTRLQLDGTPIKELPELPPSLCYLTTHDCASLETAISIIKIISLWGTLDFTNCFKLDQKPLVAAMHLKIQVSL
jgi:Leucine-rich repeat (LRR) protein